MANLFVEDRAKSWTSRVSIERLKADTGVKRRVERNVAKRRQGEASKPTRECPIDARGDERAPAAFSSVSRFHVELDEVSVTVRARRNESESQRDVCVVDCHEQPFSRAATSKTSVSRSGSEAALASPTTAKRPAARASIPASNGKSYSVATRIMKGIYARTSEV